LTLVGAVLTTAIAAGLLVPGVLGDQSPSDIGSDETTLGPDAPTPNDQFTPATDGGNDGYGEHEEYEDDEYEDDDDEDDDDDEHEDEDDEYDDTLNVPRTSAGDPL
jgi:hypothetical protein